MKTYIYTFLGLLCQCGYLHPMHLAKGVGVGREKRERGASVMCSFYISLKDFDTSQTMYH